MTLSIQGTNFWIFVYTPGTGNKNNKSQIHRLIFSFKYVACTYSVRDRIQFPEYSKKGKKYI